MSQVLLDRLSDRTARVVVVGIGYVGLPLALELARGGFRVVGLDQDADKVTAIQSGRSYLADVPDEALHEQISAGRLEATGDESCVADADAVVLCVPTPLNKTKDPDISFILEATNIVSRHAHAGLLVVLESTSYPGTTREIVAPQLSKTGLVVGRDLFIAFSPERVDPGNKDWNVRNTPKVVGGMTPACLEAARRLYTPAVDTLVPVSNTDAAEMTKLLENTFRAVNIGLVNEVALMCERLGLDTSEVIDAAGTKPFGFMTFRPGPGLGGHCIPVDPLYLSWKLRTLKYTARFVELANEINRGMPEVVVRLVGEALNGDAKAVRDSAVLIVGVAYKRNIDDVRESPALDVIALLQARGAIIHYHDPHVPRLRASGLSLDHIAEPRWGDYDCVVILADHDAVDVGPMVRDAKLVVDTRNATRGMPPEGARLVKL